MPKILLWTDVDRVHLSSRLLDDLNGCVQIIAAGGPRSAEIDDLALAHQASRYDDFRSMTVEETSDCILLTSLAGVELKDIVQAGALVFATEPLACELSSLKALYSPGRLRQRASAGIQAEETLQRVINIPAFVNGYGFSQARDSLDLVGENLMIDFRSYQAPESISLFAGLFDGWRTVLSFADTPVCVTCSLGGVGSNVAGDLRQLRGSVIAHGRSSGGNHISICVSDSAVVTNRFLQVVGDRAQLRVSDYGYSLNLVAGHEDSEGSLHQQGDWSQLVELAAEQFKEVISQPLDMNWALTPHRHSQILACCQACLLSVRTGQTENPGKFLEINM